MGGLSRPDPPISPQTGDAMREVAIVRQQQSWAKVRPTFQLARMVRPQVADPAESKGLAGAIRPIHASPLCPPAASAAAQ
jgi:hypothetical protein